jgi:hypothetical protein
MSEFFTCPGCGQSLRRNGRSITPTHFDSAGYPCAREFFPIPDPAPAAAAHQEALTAPAETEGSGT